MHRLAKAKTHAAMTKSTADCLSARFSWGSCSCFPFSQQHQRRIFEAKHTYLWLHFEVGGDTCSTNLCSAEILTTGWMSYKIPNDGKRQFLPANVPQNFEWRKRRECLHAWLPAPLRRELRSTDPLNQPEWNNVDGGWFERFVTRKL